MRPTRAADSSLRIMFAGVGKVTNDHSQPCVHGDLTQIMPSNSFDPESGFEAKAAQINQAKLRTTQYCFTHDRQCPIFGKRAREVDLDVSGLPCPDFSAMVFCSHAKFHAAWQTPMLIIENVPDLDLGMITYLYSKHYRIRCLRVMPAHQGHAGVARERVYLILTLKKSVVEIANPEDMYKKVSDFIMSWVCTEPKDCEC
ncbi:unnamed protein product [Durusdinium trenchii]|uniref:Uncharacterized protein n=2 Tax=Durusdinium trenchii TaxID=1381693 RepID=A0ABP0RD05_9DINO